MTCSGIIPHHSRSPTWHEPEGTDMLLPHIKSSSLSPLNFGSFTDSISRATTELSKAPENQEKIHQELHHGTGQDCQKVVNTAQKGDTRGLTKAGTVLPESIWLMQAETRLIRSIKWRRTCVTVHLYKVPRPKFQPDHQTLSRTKKNIM
jgi:hypothetical protein